MKKTLLLLAAPALLFFAGCGSKPAPAAAMPGMVEKTFKVNGSNLTIMVPDSTKGIAEITEQPSGATEIKVGADFQISVEEGEGDIALTKSDVKDAAVFKFQRYLKDEPALLFWESKNADIPDSRFHFYTTAKIGKSSYIIKDVESADAHNEKTVQLMIDASKTIKAKDAAKPNS